LLPDLIIYIPFVVAHWLSRTVNQFVAYIKRRLHDLSACKMVVQPAVSCIRSL